MMTNSTAHGSRINLRTLPQQDTVLRRAAKLTNKSLADFILDSAYRVAEQTLLDNEQTQAIAELFDRPAGNNPGLKDLLSRPVPWSD